MPLDPELVTDCTISCTDLITFAPMPYVASYVTGLFVRVKTRRLGESEYVLGRIRQLVPCSPYVANDHDLRQVDIELQVDSLPTKVSLANVSNRKPLVEEVENYALAWAASEELVAELNLLRNNIKKLKNHIPTLEEDRIIIRKNSELARSKANPVVELTALYRRRSYEMTASQEDPMPRLSSASSAMMSPARATQPLDAGMFSPDDATATRMHRLQASVSDYIAQSSRQGEHLRLLTERNKAENNANTVKASENFVKYAKHGHFTQSQLCWEVNDDKRAELCRDEEKTDNDKKDAKKDKGATAATNSEADKDAVQMEKVATAAKDFQRLHCFSFDDLAEVEVDSLDVITPGRLTAAHTKRSRAGSSLPPTQVV